MPNYLPHKIIFIPLYENHEGDGKTASDIWEDEQQRDDDLVYIEKKFHDELQKENAKLREDRDYYKKIAKTRDEWNTVLAKKDTQQAKVIEALKETKKRLLVELADWENGDIRIGS